MPYSGRQTLADAIIDIVQEPLVVLDADHLVVAAGKSFYATFSTAAEQTIGCSFFEIGSRQWDIAALRTALANTLADGIPMIAYEAAADFPVLGHRIMMVNASKVIDETNQSAGLLVAISDVTDQRALVTLLREKELLLREMSHRVANSLQIIASILLIKANSVQSEDTRKHLYDAHERVVAVNRVQQQLTPASERGGQIVAATYLAGLCDSLAASMIDHRPITLRLDAAPGQVSSEHAVSMGLITTELVINALKHAFPGDPKGHIQVRFESTESHWRLSVADDGIGISTMLDTPPKSGLGTSILEALTRQLGGRMLTSSNAPGTTVAITVPRTVAGVA